MGDKSTIEWTDATWNPVTGCTKVSAGCKHCYAERVFPRVYGEVRIIVPTPAEGGAGVDWIAPDTPTGHWTRPRRFTDVFFHEDRLVQPLRWRKPRRVFVNSMSDLFHEDVTDEQIKEIFTVMAIARNHVFQVLTKRPVRMMDLVSSWRADDMCDYWHAFDDGPREIDAWPLLNVWLGVSCEDQKTADERIPILLETPAAVRFVSAEPLIGPITFSRLHAHCPTHDFGGGFCIYSCPDLVTMDWVIVGGESGPKARPMDIEWARSIVGQCGTAGVPVFVKQLGSYGILDSRYDRSVPGWTRKLTDPKGGDPEEWPVDLRIRQSPEAPR
jgi:protein gp37